MQLTKEQSKGLDIAVQRYLEGAKCTVIAGYAGSGKSTTVRFIISALSEYGIDPEKDVVYTSYTGKACMVLKEKGNKNVKTLCKLIYNYKPKPDGTFFRTLKQTIEYKVVVVDEVSMVPLSMIEQLSKYNCYCICLGDPFQLPPINKDEDNHLLDSPHIFLSQIMRQAKESEIIRLSMDIREQKTLQYYKGKDIQVLPKSELSQGMLTWADEVLVAKNDTRFKINQLLRKLNGKEGEPQVGDKIIFLHNYWDILSCPTEDGERYPIVNGTIGYLTGVPFPTGFKVPAWCGKEGFVNFISSNVKTELNEMYNNLDLDSHMLQTNKPCLDTVTRYRLKKNRKRHYPDPMEVAYGYAITGHKSQGSQWDKVLVIEENFPFQHEEHARWLYTCVTRSSEKCVLITRR